MVPDLAEFAHDLASDPLAAAGFSRGQWSRFTSGGRTGQDSLAWLQTVTTTSISRARSQSKAFEYCSEMSIPFSCIARAAYGFSRLGAVPALSVATRPWPWCRARPSAIWLRAELPVQTNMTLVGRLLPPPSCCSRGGVPDYRRTAAGRPIVEVAK